MKLNAAAVIRYVTDGAVQPVGDTFISYDEANGVYRYYDNTGRHFFPEEVESALSLEDYELLEAATAQDTEYLLLHLERLKPSACWSPKSDIGLRPEPDWIADQMREFNIDVSTSDPIDYELLNDMLRALAAALPHLQTMVSAESTREQLLKAYSELRTAYTVWR